MQATKIERQEILKLVAMEVLGIGIKRQAITPPAILKTMVFMMMEFLECLRVMEDMDLGLK